MGTLLAVPIINVSLCHLRVSLYHLRDFYKGTSCLSPEHCIPEARGADPTRVVYSDGTDPRSDHMQTFICLGLGVWDSGFWIRIQVGFKIKVRFGVLDLL